MLPLIITNALGSLRRITNALSSGGDGITNALSSGGGRITNHKCQYRRGIELQITNYKFRDISSGGLTIFFVLGR